MKDLYSGTESSAKDKKTDQGQLKIEDKSQKGGSAQGHIAYRVLLRPLITEKAADMGPENKYVFAVSPKANKIEIAQAIQEVYGVKPNAVNVINVSGKRVRQGRISGQRKDWRKAVVTLPAGKTINIYEGV